MKKNESALIARSINKLVIKKLKNLNNERGLDVNTKDEYKYLWILYGIEFINKIINNKINKLFIKIKYISALKCNFAKFDLLQEFFNYNEIIFLLKCLETAVQLFDCCATVKWHGKGTSGTLWWTRSIHGKIACWHQFCQ